MKKVMILAYDFPPYNSAAARRPASWVKYFHDFDLHPIVVTRHWDCKYQNGLDYISPSSSKKDTIEKNDKYTIIKSPYFPSISNRLLLSGKFKFIRKIFTLLDVVNEHLFFKGPKYSIYNSANKFLMNNKVDYILVTGGPFILFHFASKLSKLHNIKWIADYRDGWSTNYLTNDATLIQRLFYKVILKRNELKTLNSVFKVTTVSQPLVNELKQFLNFQDVHLITNGYDPDVFKSLNKSQNTETFTIAYSGAILAYQRLDVFMNGFQLFVNKHNPNCKLIFYGLNDLICEHKKPHRTHPDIAKHISYTNLMEYKKVLDRLCQAHVLLVLSNENIDGSCTKIFDYLALNRKILVSVDDNGTIHNIIENTNAGFLCKNEQEVEEKLFEMYQEFRRNKQVLGTTTNVEQYTRREQAKKMSLLLGN